MLPELVTESGWPGDGWPFHENWAAFDLSPLIVTSHLHWTLPQTTVDATSKDQTWISSVKSVVVLKQSPSNKEHLQSVLGVGRAYGEISWTLCLEGSLRLTVRLISSISHKAKGLQRYEQLLVLGCVMGPTRAQMLPVTLKTTNSCLVGGNWWCLAGKEKVQWEKVDTWQLWEEEVLILYSRKGQKLERIFSSN